MRVFDPQKNLSLLQEIKTDNENLIVANSSKELDPGNYTVKIHYLYEDGTFDHSLSTYDFNLSCSRVDDATPTTTTTTSEM